MPSKLWEPGFPFSPARLPVFYGWVIVAAASVGIVFSIPGQTMGFSVFTDTLMRELGLSRVQLSTAYFVGTVMSGFTLPALGIWFDRLGARRMIVYSSLATGIILFYLSQVKSLNDSLSLLGTPVVTAFVLITLGFYLIRASAQGVLTMTSRNAIGKWFDHQRGIALAVSGTVTAFAFSFAPEALNRMVQRFGYVDTWLLLGALTIFLMAPLGWLVFRDNPEECGLRMDGVTANSAPIRVNEDMKIHRDLTRAEALRTWPFWAFNLSFSFYSLFATAFTFHIESIGELADRSDKIFSYFVPMSIVSVATNIGVGWLSARTRLKYLLAAMNVAALAGVLGLIYLKTTPGLVAYVVGNGICGGCFSALTGIVWPRFYGRSFLGAISGLGMSSMVIASGIGPLFFGLAHSNDGQYDSAFWICACIPAVLTICSFWADNPQRKLAG